MNNPRSNPRDTNIGVFCIVEHGDKILLVKKNYDNKSWMLPGGAVKPGEGTREALIREVREETGQVLTNLRYVGAFYSRDHYSMALCFRADGGGPECGTFSPQEISEVGLFGRNELPEPMSPRYRYWIDFYFNHGVSAADNLRDFD